MIHRSTQILAILPPLSTLPGRQNPSFSLLLNSGLVRSCLLFTPRCDKTCPPRTPSARRVVSDRQHPRDHHFRPELPQDPRCCLECCARGSHIVNQHHVLARKPPTPG